MLILSRRSEESIDIAEGTIIVKILSIRGDVVRLGFTCDKDIRIMRTEILRNEVQNNNQEK